MDFYHFSLINSWMPFIFHVTYEFLSTGSRMPFISYDIRDYYNVLIITHGN